MVEEEFSRISYPSPEGQHPRAEWMHQAEQDDPWTVIDDPQDYRLDDIRHLHASDSRLPFPDGRPRPQGLVIAEGSLVVGRLVASAYPVRCVVGFPEKLRQLLAEASQHSAYVQSRVHAAQLYAVSREVLHKVVGFDMHRGLVAAAERRAPRTVQSVLEQLDADPATSGVVCVVEGVGDHENIGAIFRNAAGLGVDAVFFGAATADPLYRRSVRVSMGHVLGVPFARFPGSITTWQRALRWLKERGYTVIAMTPHAQQEIQNVVASVRAHTGSNRGKRVAIMVGAEGSGLSEHAMRAADVRARIPMQPGTDSLNVATAAAIGFYAATVAGASSISGALGEIP